jgi:Protein of unknown function (DUF2934)
MAETTKKPTARKKTSASASAPKSIAPNRKTATKVTEMRTVTDHDIALLAHRFWNERGRRHGHDAEDWLRAEQELRGKAS